MSRVKPAKTKLIRAAQYEQINEVRLLLEAGADPNAQDGRKSNETALHESCYHGDIEMTRLLLEAGADPNIANDWENTPLHHAIWQCRGNPKVIALLLSHGSNPDVPMNTRDSRNGLFPLHVACQVGWPKVTQLLLEHGADANVLSEKGDKPLDRVLVMKDSNPAREKLLDLFRQYAPEAVMEAYCSRGPRP